MVSVVLISLVISFVNWVVLKEVRTNWIYYPGSRHEQYLFLFLLGIFDLASFAFLKFLSKKARNVFKIFISTTLVFLSLLALHDVVYGWREESLRAEFLILAVTLLYFFWLKI